MPESAIRNAEHARRRRTVISMGVALAAASLLLFVLALVRGPSPEWGIAGVLGGLVATMGGLSVAAWRGHVRLAGIGLTALVLFGVVVGPVIRQQVGYAPFYLVLAVVVAAAALEPRDVGITLAMSMAGLGIMAMTSREFTQHPEPPGSDLINGAILLGLLGGMAWLVSIGVSRLLGDLGRREREAEAAREEARRSSAHAELIAENTGDLITLFDHERKVLWASPAHRRVIGVDERGLNVVEARPQLVHPEDYLVLRETIGAAIAGQASTCQARVRRADGSWGWFQSIATPVPGEQLVVVSSRDVSEVRALSAQLEASQKMEALGRLAGGVAHDFNNLLSVMQTCASLARSQLQADSAAAHDLADLQSAIERASALTKQLLAFSRRDVVAPSRLDVGSVVGPVLDMVRRLLGRDIEVRFTVEPGAWPVRAATSQLEQVVVNLAVNARDAMPDGGLLELQVAPARDEALGEVVRLSVRDTGSGMSEETKARIFEPFFTTKPPGRGTGLGLATVYGVVRSLGGRIDVETALGEGTEFRVLLPRAPAVTAESPVPQGAVVARPVQRVFVVDDDAAVRGLMRKVLAGGGLQVREFPGGAEAIAALDGSEVPDALVTDVMLPGVDGVRVAEAFLARVPALRVVLVSGFAPDPAATARLLARGARFLPKPFSPAQLVAAVSEASAGRGASGTGPSPSESGQP